MLSREQYKTCPEHNRDAVKRYIEDRLEPGGYLRAVFEGDLFNAYSRADSSSMLGMKQLILWIYNTAPMQSYGSPKAVDKWLHNQ